MGQIRNRLIAAILNDKCDAVLLTIITVVNLFVVIAACWLT